MGVDRGLRRRVERLLSDDFGVEDLNRIFMSLRERFYSRHSFQEIGHFNAHADERVRGVVTDRAKNFFLTLKWHIPRHLPSPPPSVTGKEFGDFLTANLSLIGEPPLGYSLEQCRSLIGRVARKIDVIHGRDVYAHRPLTKAEADLAAHISSLIISKPAFTGAELLDDFIYVLQRNKLLSEDEVPAIRHIEDRLSLYAIVQMHDCTVVLDKSFSAELHAGFHGGERHLSVAASAAVPVPVSSPTGRPTLTSSFPVFTCTVDASGISDPELHGPSWDFPIELGSDWRLRRL